ncbi:uncharacterized protein [Oscarella lobularis]|uniref:uncharacterized protein n=1 Tax=Oscarella lobularis TaxID=121494 RepID=UPI003313C29A
MVGSTDDFVSVLKFAAKALFERLPHVNDLSNYLISPMVLSLTPHIYSTVEKMLRMGILDEEVDPGLVDCGCQLALSYRHYDEAGFLCSLRVKAFEANSTTISDEETSLRKRNYYYDFAVSQYCLKNLKEVDVNIRRSLSGISCKTLTSSDILFFHKAMLLLADSQEFQGFTSDAEDTLQSLLRVSDSFETLAAAAISFDVYLRLSLVYNSLERVDDELGVSC